LASYSHLKAEIGTGRLSLEALSANSRRWVSNQVRFGNRGTLTEQHRQMLDAIPGWEWATLRDRQWALRLEELRARSIDRQQISDELASWILRQRKAYGSGSLTDSRARLLQSVDGWQWRPGDFGERDILMEQGRQRQRRTNRDWGENLDRLCAFHTKFGTANVPQHFVDVDGHALGQWVSRQRKNYAKGKLSQERVAMLQAIPGWQWKAPASGRKSLIEAYLAGALSRSFGDFRCRIGRWAVDMLWEDHKLVVEYDGAYWHSGREEHDQKKSIELAALGYEVVRVREAPLQPLLGGDLVVPESSSAVEVAVLTAAHLRSRGYPVSDDFAAPPVSEMAPLEMDTDKEWEAMASRVQALIAAGEQLPNAYVDDSGARVGNWAWRQRDLYRRGLLPRTRVDRLRQMPGWEWEPQYNLARYQRNFYERLEDVAAHLRAGGDLTASSTGVGNWAATMRSRYRSGTMPAYQIAALEATPGWHWESTRAIADDARWARIADIAESYARDEGLVPSAAIVGEVNLGDWASKQRYDYRRGRLRASRAERLQRIPGWQWNPSEALRNTLESCK